MDTVFEQNGFALQMLPILGGGIPNRQCWRYRFFDNGKLVFEGEDYSSYMRDSAAWIGLLGFFALSPKDSDSGLFDGYTPEQLAWCESGRTEDLSIIVNDLENLQENDD